MLETGLARKFSRVEIGPGPGPNRDCAKPVTDRVRPGPGSKQAIGPARAHSRPYCQVRHTYMLAGAQPTVLGGLLLIFQKLN